jgi:predicted DNA-binding protein
MRLEWEQRLDAIRQRDDETTGSYYHRFRLEFDAMQAAGVQIVAMPFVPGTEAEQEAMGQALLEMEDKIMAMKFLRKLDRKRYGNWLDHLE